MGRDRIELKLTGIEQVQRNLRRFGKTANAEFVRALVSEAKLVIAKSQVFVPRDTGALASTGIVPRPMVAAGSVTVEMRYGGAKAPYALKQHEDFTYRHKSPQQVKYLEAAFWPAVPGLTRRIALRLKVALKRGPRLDPSRLPG